MRVLRNMLMALMALMLCSAFTLKEKKGEGVFLFGIAASFNDSVVYFTPIQRVDSVKLENGFLPKRAQYAYQLKNQIEVAQGKTGTFTGYYRCTNLLGCKVIGGNTGYQDCSIMGGCTVENTTTATAGSSVETINLRAVYTGR